MVSEWLLYGSIIILCLYIFLQAMNVAALLFLKPDKTKALSDDELPGISILLAARNEEKNILRCLNALHKLNYPAHKIEILIGDDNSEDGTKSLAEIFIADKTQFKLFSITSQLGKARGKANVLAQLAHQAKGKYFLITDADIAVKPDWAREMVSYFNSETGIVGGITIVEDDKTFLGKMQETEWTYLMGLLKGFDVYGMKSTAMGNNMAVSATAYRSVGGYENIDFSVTEDFKLFKEIRQHGWQTKNIFNKETLNISRPVESFDALLNQRKRWLTGGKELSVYWWIAFSIFGLFTPAIIVLLFFDMKLALLFYAVKLFLQSLSILIVRQKLQQQKRFYNLFVYELYNIITSFGTPVFFFLPLGMKWKNRLYK